MNEFDPFKGGRTHSLKFSRFEISRGTHVVFLTPMQLMNLKMCFDNTYSELTGKNVPQFVL